MNRAPFALIVALGVAGATSLRAAEIYVAPTGDDRGPGTRQSPLASVTRALYVARDIRSEPVTIYLRAGAHYLDAPVTPGPGDSRTSTSPLIFTAIHANFLHVDGGDTGEATALQRISGADGASRTGDALFVDESAGDYRGREGSAALGTGFRKFPMTGLGVVSGRLRTIARQPTLPGSPEEAAIINGGWGQSKVLSPHKKSRKTRRLGAVVRIVRTEGDRSAAGLDALRGVLVLDVSPTSEAERIGLRKLDVILGLDGSVRDVHDLMIRMKAAENRDSLTIEVWRNQTATELKTARSSKR